MRSGAASLPVGWLVHLFVFLLCINDEPRYFNEDIPRVPASSAYARPDTPRWGSFGRDAEGSVALCFCSRLPDGNLPNRRTRRHRQVETASVGVYVCRSPSFSPPPFSIDFMPYLFFLFLFLPSPSSSSLLPSFFLYYFLSRSIPRSSRYQCIVTSPESVTTFAATATERFYRTSNKLFSLFVKFGYLTPLPHYQIPRNPQPIASSPNSKHRGKNI